MIRLMANEESDSAGRTNNRIICHYTIHIVMENQPMSLVQGPDPDLRRNVPGIPGILPGERTEKPQQGFLVPVKKDQNPPAVDRTAGGISVSKAPAETDKENPQIPSPLKDILSMVIALMEPDNIFLLDTYTPDAGGKPVYDLLIAISGKDARPHSDYVIILEHISLKIHPVTAIVLNTGSLGKMLAAGHIYYSRVCCSRNLLFDAGRCRLPVPGALPVTDIITRARADFDNRLQRASSFLKGSRYFLQEKQKGLAAFMLHQSVEQIYRGILQGLTAKETVTHNLRMLMANCRRCAPELCTVFLTGREEEEYQLRKLQKAYISPRYKNDYEISDPELDALTGRARYLQTLAREVFNRKIHEAAEALALS